MGMRKLTLIKLIYFIVIAALAFTFVLLSFFSANGREDRLVSVSSVREILDFTIATTPRPTGSPANEDLRGRITNFLSNTGFVDASHPANVNARFTYERQTARLYNRHIRRYAELEGIPQNEVVYGLPFYVNNIVVRVHGTENSTGTILLMAHHDTINIQGGQVSGAGGQGSSSVAIANMLNLLRSLYIDHHLMAGESHLNDIVVVFTDARHNPNNINLGAYVFADPEFALWGANDIAHMSNIEVAFNFDSLGAGGTMVMLGTANEDSDLLRRATRFSRNTFQSSLLSHLNRNNDSSLSFLNNLGGEGGLLEGSVIGATFTNFGRAHYFQTLSDTNANLSDAYISQQGALMLRLTTFFGRGYNLQNVSGASNQVFFSYLNAFTIRYHVGVAWVLLILMLGLLGAVVFFNHKTKFVTPKKTLIGAGVQLIALGASMLVIWLIMLIVGLFGLMGVQIGLLMSSSTFSSTLLQISFLSMAVLFSLIAYTVFSRIFRVKARSIVYGNILIFVLLSIISTIFIPAASYLFTLITIMQLGIMLAMILLENKYKEVAGQSIKLLGLTAIPLVLFIPVYLTLFLVLAQAYGVTAYPILVMFIILPGGFALPYLAQLKTALSSLERKTRIDFSWFSESVVTITLFFFAATFFLVEVVAPTSNAALSANIRHNRHHFNPTYTSALIYTKNNSTNTATWTLKDRNLLPFLPNRVTDLLSRNRSTGTYSFSTTNTNHDFFVDIPFNTSIQILQRSAYNSYIFQIANSASIAPSVFGQANTNISFYNPMLPNGQRLVQYINLERHDRDFSDTVIAVLAEENLIDVSNISHVNINLSDMPLTVGVEYFYFEIVLADYSVGQLPTITITEQSFHIGALISNDDFAYIHSDILSDAITQNLRIGVQLINVVNLNSIDFSNNTLQVFS
ncbi:MAG: M28 family peptidase [Firmicutes bacterium]|nr:M28 family peptidase [Bacillota bacterium]